MSYHFQHGNQLPLDRCPHCQTATPRLERQWSTTTADHAGDNKRDWCCYVCASCGGIVMAWSHGSSYSISEIWPEPLVVSKVLPERVYDLLSQAHEAQRAPAGAVMLAASAVDSMLKHKGLKEGSLYDRIDRASKDHLITAEMAAWAHEVRLDANDQRHADESAPLPSAADAKKVIEFASALAQFMFVLPERVARGRKAAVATPNRSTPA